MKYVIAQFVYMISLYKSWHMENVYDIGSQNASKSTQNMLSRDLKNKMYCKKKYICIVKKKIKCLHVAAYEQFLKNPGNN